MAVFERRYVLTKLTKKLLWLFMYAKVSLLLESYNHQK